MFMEERKEKIIKIVEGSSSVSVAELSAVFGVSEVTIRKDLKELSLGGYIKRTHGGAIQVNETALELTQLEKENTFLNEKKAIAKAAFCTLKAGDTIILDSGTTTHELAKLIKQDKLKLTVITNALNIALDLCAMEESIDLIFIGGNVRTKILSCVGPLAEDGFKNISVDKAFLGINNISVERGLSTPNIFEAHIKQYMISAANKKYLLVDKSKFDTVSTFHVCALTAFDQIITNEGRKLEKLESLVNSGTQFLEVPVNNI